MKSRNKCNFVRLTRIAAVHYVLSMKAKVVHSGDLSGISLPEPLLQQFHFKDEVDVEIREDCLIISLPKISRQGWDSAFQKMAETGDDHFILNDAMPNRWDAEEWEW